MEKVRRAMKTTQTCKHQEPNATEALRLAEERLNLSLSAGNLAWWDMDCVTGKVVFNEHKVKMLGYSMDDFQDVTYSAFTDLVHPDDYEKAMRAMRDHLSGKKELYEVEYRIKAKDGAYKWFHDRGSILERDDSGNPLRVKGVVFDVTERKKSEIALQKAHEELQELNAHLEDRVNQQTQELERLLNQKTSFIVQLGHDLRTPLGPINNLIPLIGKKGVDEKMREMVAVVNENVHVLNEMVRKTVKFATVTSSDFVPTCRDVNAADVLKEVLHQKKDDIEKADVRVENRLDSDVLVTTDKKYLVDVFEELLSNALTFSDDGGVVILDSDVKEDMIIFSVKDDGMGLTSQQLDHVFDEFYKADESRHNLENHGLGLTIAKIIVERLGGSMWVESDGLGKGSTFFFSLPISQSCEEGKQFEQ